MVVLQLGPYPPPHGGVQSNLVAIRNHLRRHRIAAPVINLTRNRRTSDDEVYYPRTALEVLQLLVGIRADIVHLHVGGRFTPRLLALSLLCSLLPRRRVVLTLHSGGYPSSEDGRNVRRSSLSAWTFRRFDAVIAVNAEIATLFRRAGVDPARVELICPYAAVSLPENVVLPAQLREFRESHRPLLTTVGLLEPEYDLALQIRALPTVRRRFPGAGLVIVGSGSLEDELRHLIATTPGGPHVLLCGDVPHPLTVRLIAESDVFLRTTLYDGDSVSVREALQLGVPVIASDNGMRPLGARLVPASDESALCDAIEAVLRNPAPNPPAAESKDNLDAVLALYSRLVGHEVRSRELPPPSVL